MPSNAIRQIVQTEQECMEHKNAAINEAKKLIDHARQAGEDVLRTARIEAENSVKERLARAEAQGSLRAAETTEQILRECSALRRTSETRLEHASAIIIKSIVGN